MRKVLVVGSGAGGAAAARELSRSFAVTVLEAGREFRPFPLSLRTAERFKRLGLLLRERQIKLLFPAMDVRTTREGLVLVRGVATGGTTTIFTANALRLDGDLRAIGIDLDAEFAELRRDVPITEAHREKWRPLTRRLFDTFMEAGLEPRPMPKMMDAAACRGCGRCVLGCPTGARWDSRRFLDDARALGADVLTGCRVERIVTERDAVAVIVRRGVRHRVFRADAVVLAAGGFETPRILERSGIACEPRLFVDPVLCVATQWPGAAQDRELPMPFYSDQERYILSPYFDYLSYFFNRDWRPKSGDILSLMIKLADEERGETGRRRVRKKLTGADRSRLGEAVDVCTGLFRRLGIRENRVFLGTVNAGHPGGMLPLGPADTGTLHPARLPNRVYVADGTLLPRSHGKPPSLTIMALAIRVARSLAARWA